MLVVCNDTTTDGNFTILKDNPAWKDNKPITNTNYPQGPHAEYLSWHEDIRNASLDTTSDSVGIPYSIILSLDDHNQWVCHKSLKLLFIVCNLIFCVNTFPK